jgi:hypothetical protein
MNSAFKKFNLYLISLAALFVFFIVLTINVPDQLDFKSCRAWLDLLAGNYVSVISLVALIYSIFAYRRFRFELEGAPKIPFKITKIEGANYEHLTFLATYIVPLVSFDFGNDRQMIVLAILLFLMGIIYVKTDLFYANPSLALLGFHIYKVDGDFKTDSKTGIILICREKLQANQKVSYLKLDERIYFVRGAAK